MHIHEIAFGLAILAANLAAWVAPTPERRALKACAAVIAINWALECGPWHGYGFRIWLDLPNNAQSDAMVFALQDASAAAFIIGVWAEEQRRWLLAIWTIIIAQVGLDTVYFSGGDPIWHAYSFAADATLSLMLAIICFKGTPGVAEFAARSIDSLRNLRYTLAATPRPQGRHARRSREEGLKRGRNPRSD